MSLCPGQPGHSCCSRWKERGPTRVDPATARALFDVDYAFLSTAPARRREVMATRMQSAAHTLSDVDYVFLSTAPARRREASWNWTWMDAATCGWARSSAGSNRDHPRTHLQATPSPHFPPVIPSSPSPLRPPPTHTHSLTS